MTSDAPTESKPPASTPPKTDPKKLKEQERLIWIGVGSFVGGVFVASFQANLALGLVAALGIGYGAVMHVALQRERRKKAEPKKGASA